MVTEKQSAVSDVEETCHKVNKRGFTLIEIVGVIIIIAILAVAGISAMNNILNSTRVTTAQEDLAGFKTAIESFMIENPQYAKGGTTSIKDIVQTLNDNYLEGEMKVSNSASITALSGTDGKIELSRLDPWKMPYVLHVSVVDKGLGDPATTDADSVLRIAVVSSGKNTNTSTTTSAFVAAGLDGQDDIALLTQCINGTVSSTYVGTKQGALKKSDGTTTLATVALVEGKWTEKA